MQDELEMIEREEHRARLRYEEAKERSLLNDGVAPTEDEGILRKLEEEWKEVRERLHLARRRAGS